MAVGSPRYLSFPVSCVMDCHLKTQWPKPKCLRSVLSPSVWNMASRRLSQSTFLCRWLHEPVAFVKGQARSRCAFRPWLDHQASIWVTPHAHSRGLARFHLCVPRRRRNRTTYACPYRQAHRPYSERSVVLVKSPATPNHSFEGTAEKLRFSVPSALRAPVALDLERWRPTAVRADRGRASPWPRERESAHRARVCRPGRHGVS